MTSCLNEEEDVCFEEEDDVYVSTRGGYCEIINMTPTSQKEEEEEEEEEEKAEEKKRGS